MTTAEAVKTVAILTAHGRPMVRWQEVSGRSAVTEKTGDATLPGPPISDCGRCLVAPIHHGHLVVFQIDLRSRPLLV